MSKFLHETVQANQPIGAQHDHSPPPASSIALVLGGGAAKGLAHIPVLEAFDELGLRPHVMAGTSIGAMIGACYASGMTGGEIRDYSQKLFETRRELVLRLFKSRDISWPSIFALSNSAIAAPEVLLKLVLPSHLPETFSGLTIPLNIVATDFDSQSEVVLDEGPLITAIAASSALPALLRPVKRDQRLLIDGGFSNPTPFDIVKDKAQFTVAVDVTGKQDRPQTKAPSVMHVVIGASQIAIRSVMLAKLKCSRPDVLLRPDIGQFHSLDFYKLNEILDAAAPIKETAKRELERILR